MNQERTYFCCLECAYTKAYYPVLSEHRKKSSLLRKFFIILPLKIVGKNYFYNENSDSQSYSVKNPLPLRLSADTPLPPSPSYVYFLLFFLSIVTMHNKKAIKRWNYALKCGQISARYSKISFWFKICYKCTPLFTWFELKKNKKKTWMILDL